MNNHSHANGSNIQLHISTIKYSKVTCMFLTEFSNLDQLLYFLHVEAYKSLENGPERFEPMAPCTSDPYRTLRIFFTRLHSVEAVC